MKNFVIEFEAIKKDGTSGKFDVLISFHSFDEAESYVSEFMPYATVKGEFVRSEQFKSCLNLNLKIIK